MPSLYGFNPVTCRFTIEVKGADYTFSYDLERGTPVNFRDANNQSMGRTYKGFRNRLGIQPGSAEASALMTEIRKARQILEQPA